MKLRLRSFQSKETLKIEVPDSCTLPQLKQILSETLTNSPLPTSIRLSLNRKDELQFDNGETLQFLGIASGDLIFFSVDQPAAFTTSNSQNALSPVTVSTPMPQTNDSEVCTSSNTQNPLSDVPNSDSMALDSDSRKGETLGAGSKMKEAVNDMEIDGENSSNSDVLLEEVVDTSFSVPGFLRKVFAKELGDDDGRLHKLVIIAVHAVILESGFVGFDDKANKVVDGFQFRNEWPSGGLFTLSLSYTLPESLSSGAGKSIVLKFQSLGKFMIVYGTLSSGEGKRGVYSVRLNEDELVPVLNVVWANCGNVVYSSGKDGDVLDSFPENEVFKFWRIVKDNLALPLLIDFCEEAGFELPPCLTRLPTELKLKILELLPGSDVAKVSCVCSEFRYLASSEDLWMTKFNSEFKNEEKEAHMNWKKAFSLAWSRRIGRKLAGRVRSSPYWREPSYMPESRRRYPNPFMVPRAPRIIGGDSDILPPPFGDFQVWDSVNHPMGSFSPQCNLGDRLFRRF